MSYRRTREPGPTERRIRETLQRWKAAQGVTQRDLAAAAGLTQASMSRYFTGEIDVDVDALEAFAMIFGHSLWTLIEKPAGPSREEMALVEAFRACSPGLRIATLRLLRCAADIHGDDDEYWKEQSEKYAAATE